MDNGSNRVDCVWTHLELRVAPIAWRKPRRHCRAQLRDIVDLRILQCADELHQVAPSEAIRVNHERGGHLERGGERIAQVVLGRERAVAEIHVRPRAQRLRIPRGDALLLRRRRSHTERVGLSVGEIGGRGGGGANGETASSRGQTAYRCDRGASPC